MKQKIILIGGGGHCHSVIDVIEMEDKYEILGIVDIEENIGKKVLDYAVIACDDDLQSLFETCKHAVITVGQIKSSATRVKLFTILKEIGFHLPSIISPLAYVSKHAFVDEGTVLMHHAIINANARIGKNCIINTKALIEHDTIVEDHCHISTASVLNGGVVVKENTFFGSNSMARESIEIESNSIIGGGYECDEKSIKIFNKQTPLEIGYFADGPWSHEAFKKLINDDEIQIKFICVRFDTKDETLLNYAKQYNIDYLKHENINSEEFIKTIEKYSCDLFVSMSFNQIFKTKIMNLPKYKTINCHAGKLPFYRGRNILNWALINDEKEFGITVHYIDEGIDTGDIILQRNYPITDEDSYATLLQRAYTDCADILYDAVILFKNGFVKAKKQIEIAPVGFYCSQRKIGDEILDWNQTSREIFNFVRSICSPGPKARACINGLEMKINKVEFIENAPSYKCIIGTILNKETDGFLVKTKDSFIKIVDFDFDSKLKVGDRFEIR